MRTLIVVAALFGMAAGVGVAAPLRLSAGIFEPEAVRTAESTALDARASHVVVQFAEGHAAAVRAAVQAAGARVEAYVPERAFRVARLGVAVETLAALPGVVWVGRWRDDWKLAPRLRSASVPGDIEVYGFVDGDADTLAAAVRKIAVSRRVTAMPGTRLPRVVVQGADALVLNALAADDAVSWLAPHVPPMPQNTEASGVIQSGSAALHPLWAHGLTGSGQIVALADTGLDANERWFTRFNPGSGTLTFVTPAQATVPPAIGSLVQNAKVVGNWVQPGATAYETLAPCGSVSAVQHGTHVAGTLAGDAGLTATPMLANAEIGDGMAPNAQVLMQDIGGDCLIVDDFAATLRQARAAGAHIHNNSWGASTGNVYTGYDFDTDDTTWAVEDLLVVASAGNRDEAIAAIGSPGNAKNALTVGALLHGESRCPATLYTTNNAWGSSIGPGSGWRDKPEISAPGTATVSAAGDDQSVGAEELAVTRALSGTSMASPTVAGGAALMRQYFADGFHPRGIARSDDRRNVLAATLKAALVNGTDELINAFIGEVRLPSYITGWGRLWLDRDLYFPGDSRRLRVFERRHDAGIATGDVHEYDLHHVRAGQPLRVTLAWFDVASVPGIDYPLVNDLDLEVIGPNGEVYRGNAFSDDPSCQTQACFDPCGPAQATRPAVMVQSLDGYGSADRRNTVEAVRLLAPVAGHYRIRVIGHQVPGNDRVGSDRQGYGVVAAADFGVPDVSPAPAPPMIAVLSNDGDGIRVGIAAVAGAEHYQLHRATGSCATADIADFHLAAVSSGTELLDANTVGGDRYAYRVRAVVGDAEGAASACVEAVSQDSCSLPPDFDDRAPLVDAANDPCAIALDWTPTLPRCAFAPGLSYQVQRSASPTFASAQVWTVPSPPFIDTPLPAIAPYFYRVRAIDGFGNASAFATPRNATPSGVGGPAGLGFRDDADTRSYAELTAPWQIVESGAAEGLRAYRTSAAGARYPKSVCATLALPPFVVPDAATLRYDARYQLEADWDGVVVELSVDDGTTWIDLPPTGGYPGSFAQTQTPPINACGDPASQGAFSGDNGGYQTYASDLAAYAGQRVRIRWRLSTDPGVELDGFQLDAIRIDAPGSDRPADLILRAGFDASDAAAIGAQCAIAP